jgi:hypothetical protein
MILILEFGPDLFPVEIKAGETITPDSDQVGFRVQDSSTVRPNSLGRLVKGDVPDLVQRLLCPAPHPRIRIVLQFVEGFFGR